MDKFWKASLSIAGLAAVAFFVFFFLYKDWLQLGIFTTVTQEQTFALMVLFLVLTFGALVVGVTAWLKKERQAKVGDESLHRLEQSWKGVNYIDCDKLIGPDVEKASNALQMTSVYWRNGFLDRTLIKEQYGLPFTELFEQIDSCNKQVPGYNKPIKYCKDFLSPLVRSTYTEIKKYGK